MGEQTRPSCREHTGGKGMRWIVYLKKQWINAILLGLIILLAVSLLDDGAVEAMNRASSAPIYQGDTAKSEVAIACNIYWGSEFVPAMLDTLHAHDTKITFFIGGQWAADNPDLLRRIAEEGHEIGNHGYSHKKHSLLTLEENKREILRAQEAIYGACQVETKLFMPPSGDYGRATVDAARDVGHKTILWSVDTIDWRDQDKKVLLGRVDKMKRGDILLMHPTEATMQTLDSMLTLLEGKNLAVKTVSEILPVSLQ